MVVVKDQLDPNLRKIIKNKKQVAIIPIGSLEQHGPHLPVSTDSDIVTEINQSLLIPIMTIYNKNRFNSITR